MKKATKWILGISAATLTAGIIALLAYVGVVLSVFITIATFYDNGWALIDDEYEQRMSEESSSTDIESSTTYYVEDNENVD